MGALFFTRGLRRRILERWSLDNAPHGHREEFVHAISKAQRASHHCHRPGDSQVSSGLPIVVFGVLFLCVIAVLRMYLRGEHKGHILLSIPKTDYAFGETIRGSFSCRFKEEVRCKKASIVLVGRVIERIPPRDGERAETQEKHVHMADQHVVKLNKRYEAGQIVEVDFSLVATPPKSEPLALLTTAANFLSGTRIETVWTLEIKFDTEGIDLTREQTIRVS